MWMRMMSEMPEENNSYSKQKCILCLNRSVNRNKISAAGYTNVQTKVADPERQRKTDGGQKEGRTAKPKGKPEQIQQHYSKREARKPKSGAQCTGRRNRPHQSKKVIPEKYTCEASIGVFFYAGSS